ncbi:acetylxylan esterase, partial [bacterium]|nr:acetylxylan esterase [bacterium]
MGSAGETVSNLAPNPGIEVADGDRPALWVQRTPTDEQRTLTWDASMRRSGKRSLRIDNRAALISRWRTGHLRDMSLAPGSRGLLTAWVRTKDVRGSAFIRFYCMTAQGRIEAQPQTPPLAATQDWTELRLAFTVPAATAYVMIYLELHGTGTAWYDEVTLTGSPARPATRMDLAPVTYAAYDLECLEGYRQVTRGRSPVIELSPQARQGRAQLVFWSESARYDATVAYTDERDGASALKVLVNGRVAAAWRLDQTPPREKTQAIERERVIRGMDIQRLSRIGLEAAADGGERCRIHRVTFVAVGRFQGEFLPREKLPVPQTLPLFEGPAEQQRARAMLPGFVGAGVRRVAAARAKELAALDTPEKWRERQQRTRARLAEVFGDFRPKCPLNARVTGTLDRPDYTIEKLIFESQPGYHCTANVYVPKRRRLPRPAILFTCGHAADGKGYHLYHDACLGFALKGYVVLALDPTGQGERSEYFDPKTGKHDVPLCVSHHHYTGRPSWLVGRSLAGYRTWDCIRALDYLVARREVDPEAVAAVGNSGGGIMALLITAADGRIKVCAAAHPGGSMEQTFLTGRGAAEAEVLSLIAPRPCLMIVGEKSGEEPGHRAKLNRMLPFYLGLGVPADRAQLALVHGVHDMKQPKREAAYAWVNHWLGHEKEGGKEPPLATESGEALHCTPTGHAVADLGGETTQTLNAKAAERLRPPRPVPDGRPALAVQRETLRQAVAKRIGLSIAESRPAPVALARGTYGGAAFRAEKLLVESEPGIRLPMLLLRPTSPAREGAVILHAAERGKPARPRGPSLALELVRRGHVVLSVDVRGAGETDWRNRATLRPLTHYDPPQASFDSLAVQAATLGTTLLAMRTRDVIRSMDYLASRRELAGRPFVLVGEGLGGLWVLSAAAFDARPAAVVCVRTVPSYKLIVGARDYRVRDYFWVNGALKDFDVPDLVGLVAPRPVLLVDSVDATLERLAAERCRNLCEWPRGAYRLLGAEERLRITCTADGSEAAVAEQVAAALAAMEPQMNTDEHR